MDCPINHQDQAQSRLATQYRNSTTYIANLRAMLEEADNIEVALCDTLNLRNIDNGFGEILDVIGELVGQPRELVDASTLKVFGFDDDPFPERVDGFGEEGVPGYGAPFAEEGQPLTGTRLLTDEEYKLFIRSRIVINNTRPTIELFIESVQFVINAPEVNITEGEALINCGIGRDLTFNEVVFLTQNNLLPKPAGVSLFLFTYDPEQYFGFDDDPNAMGFGEEGMPGIIGGKFAEELTV